jgi:preprotein translocase subunit SecG
MNRTFWIVAGLFIVLVLVVAGLRTSVGTGTLSENKSASTDGDLKLVSEQSPYMRTER